MLRQGEPGKTNQGIDSQMELDIFVMSAPVRQPLTTGCGTGCIQSVHGPRSKPVRGGDIGTSDEKSLAATACRFKNESVRADMARSPARHSYFNRTDVPAPIKSRAGPEHCSPNVNKCSARTWG